MTGLALLAAALLLASPPVHQRLRGRHRPADVRATAVLPVAGAVAVTVLSIAALGGRTGVVVAALLLPCGLAGLNRLGSRAARATADPDLPKALDLAAAGLRTGLPVATALTLAVPLLAPPTAGRIAATAGLLRLGAPPGEAWADLADHPQLARLAGVARRGSCSGIRLASIWEEAARELRAELRAAALARAARAGVLAMAPLGLCFLPAFVCLGVVPDVAGLLGGSLAAVR